jgi:uncharacterized membrane protein
MSYIGKMQSVSFDTYRAPSPLGLVMQQTLHYISLVLLIPTGLVIKLIASQHLVTHSVLVLGLSVGQARSKLQFLYL